MAEEIINHIDKNKDGSIGLNEFITAFTIKDKKKKEKIHESWEFEVCQHFFSMLLEAKMEVLFINQQIHFNKTIQLKSLFLQLDKDESGGIDKEEFMTGMEALNESLFDPIPVGQLEKLYDL